MKMRLTVVGSGVMGRGIAYTALINGYFVNLIDINEKALKDAEIEINKLVQKAESRGLLVKVSEEDMKNRISYSTNLEKDVVTSDFIIEAVTEKIHIKKFVFETIDKFAPSHCILATNTSTMSPTEIGSYTKRPDKVIAMHFFNPVHKMKLVEIVRGLETSDETVSKVIEVAKCMNKETVVVNEFPGFVTSRISALIGNEAFYMLQEGVATPEEIDKAIKLGLNFPMGPFELGDLVGLDARLNNLEYLHKTLGEKYRPSPLLVKYVKAGRLGRKTGKGVYDYSNEEVKI
ncbi:3-hydroxyacyl-CoA dehydrogenase [Bacillus timonensis]|nr:3-hydroxyacyl-CoA dehydrogenase [Bacillus timonensis]